MGKAGTVSYEWEKMICLLAVLALAGGSAYWLYGGAQSAGQGRANRPIPPQPSLLTSEAETDFEKGLANIDFENRQPFFTESGKFDALLKKGRQDQKAAAQRKDNQQDDQKEDKGDGKESAPDEPGDEDKDDSGKDGQKSDNGDKDESKPEPEDPDQNGSDAAGDDDQDKNESEGKDEQQRVVEVTYLGLMKAGKKVPHAWIRVALEGAERARFVRTGARLGPYQVSEFTTTKLVLTSAEGEGEEQKVISFKETGKIKLK